MTERKWATKIRTTTGKATITPTRDDLLWAAGFLEGEGSFIRAKSCPSGCEMISAAQKEDGPLEHLQHLFGGKITSHQPDLPRHPGKAPYRIKVWQVYGARARGIMMTLFQFMCERRQGQIRLALKENYNRSIQQV